MSESLGAVRAVTHIHTRYSWDSRMRPDALAQKLRDADVTIALVTDHDSYEGALELRGISAAKGLGLRVPVAAEIRTDCGDVVVAFEDDMRPAVGVVKTWERLRLEVRDHGGLIWLPHPYRHHQRVEELAAEADVIEVFNARCTPEENRRAADLCKRHQKTPGFGADAHLLREAAMWWVDYDGSGTVLDALRRPPTCHRPSPTKPSNVSIAEVINGVKRRRPALVGYFALRYARQRVLEVRAGA